jgi:hypothetical protein
MPFWLVHIFNIFFCTFSPIFCNLMFIFFISTCLARLYFSFVVFCNLCIVIVFKYLSKHHHQSGGKCLCFESVGRWSLEYADFQRYIYIYVYVCICVYACIYIYVLSPWGAGGSNMLRFKGIRIYTYVYIYIYVYIYVGVNMLSWEGIHIFIYLYICVCLYIYI